MADVTDGPITGEQSTTPSPSSAGGPKGFLATSTGKLVAIVVGLVVLGGLLAIVAVIVLGVLNGGADVQADQLIPVASNPSTSTPASGDDTRPLAPVPDVDNSEVFTPRDPFEPVMLPASATTPTTSSTASGTADPNTLTLNQIVEENGVRKGVFAVGADSYTAGAGERLGSTPWLVVSVAQYSTTMMFGDTQVGLTIGEGVQTK